MCHAQNEKTQPLTHFFFFSKKHLAAILKFLVDKITKAYEVNKNILTVFCARIYVYIYIYIFLSKIFMEQNVTCVSALEMIKEPNCVVVSGYKEPSLVIKKKIDH